MSVEFVGFDETLKTLDDIGDIGKKITTQSVKNSMRLGLEIIKANAPKRTGKSASALSIGKIKKYKSGSVWGTMGINSKNWEQTKGLYFQNYGYADKGWGNRYHGMMIDKHRGWFDNAFKQAESPMLAELENMVNSKLGEILR